MIIAKGFIVACIAAVAIVVLCFVVVHTGSFQ